MFSEPLLPASNANFVASRKNQNKQNQLSSPSTSSKNNINRQKTDRDSELVEFWINKQIYLFLVIIHPCTIYMPVAGLHPTIYNILNQSRNLQMKLLLLLPTLSQLNQETKTLNRKKPP